MEKEAIDNYYSFKERLDYYKSFGYDLLSERDFILNESLPIQGRILEIGTGKGHFTIVLAQEKYKFITTDISPEEQNIARQNIKNYGLGDLVDFRIENAENMSFEYKSFDMVFSVNLYHHLKKPYMVLDEMIRVLALNGRIILSDFTEEGMDIINRCHSNEHRKHDYFKNDFKDAEEYLRDKGFLVRSSNTRVQQIAIVSRS